jgi:hypothetical protein
MNVTRTLTLGVLGGSLAVWLAAAATSTVRRAEPRVEPRARAVDVSGAALASEIARLHDRLHPTAAPTQARDLFRYGRRSTARAGAAVAATVAPPVPDVPALVPTPSPLTLVGIAEDAGESGPVRTAIVSGFGELFMVKEHDTVTSRFRVSSVSADTVELIDTSNDTTLRLSLQ